MSASDLKITNDLESQKEIQLLRTKLDEANKKFDELNAVFSAAVKENRQFEENLKIQQKHHSDRQVIINEQEKQLKTIRLKYHELQQKLKKERDDRFKKIQSLTKANESLTKQYELFAAQEKERIKLEHSREEQRLQLAERTKELEQCQKKLYNEQAEAKQAHEQSENLIHLFTELGRLPEFSYIGIHEPAQRSLSFDDRESSVISGAAPPTPNSHSNNVDHTYSAIKRLTQSIVEKVIKTIQDITEKKGELIVKLQKATQAAQLATQIEQEQKRKIEDYHQVMEQCNQLLYVIENTTETSTGTFKESYAVNDRFSSDMSARISKTEAQVQELKHQKESLAKQNNILKTEATELTKVLHTTNAQKEEQYKNYEEQYKNYKKMRDEETKKEQAHAAEVKQLNERINALVRENNTLVETSSKTEKKLIIEMDKLHVQNNALVLDNNALVLDKQTSAKTLQDTTQQLEATKNKLKTLGGELAASQESWVKLTKLNTQEENENVQLKQQNFQLQQLLKTQQSNLESLKKNAPSLQNQMNQTNHEVELAQQAAKHKEELDKQRAELEKKFKLELESVRKQNDISEQQRQKEMVKDKSAAEAQQQQQQQQKQQQQKQQQQQQRAQGAEYSSYDFSGLHAEIRRCKRIAKRIEQMQQERAVRAAVRAAAQQPQPILYQQQLQQLQAAAAAQSKQTVSASQSVRIQQ